MAGSIGRRDFLNGAAAVGALMAMPAGAQTRRGAAAAAVADAELYWLDGAAPVAHEGQVWGTPWPRGTQKAKASFALSGADGPIPVQTWTTGYWPDGSIKWTAHAIPAGAGTGGLRISAGKPAAPRDTVSVRDTAEAVEVSNGRVRWRIGKSGESIILSATNGSRQVLKDVKLVASTQDKADAEQGAVARTQFVGNIEKVTVEQTGPVRAVVKVDGKHQGGGRAWLPFSLRLVFLSGSEGVKVMHSFIFDGDPEKDFISSLGLTGTVPMEDPAFNRHVRFGGENGGLWAEAVQTLTGLRRDPGKKFRDAQIAGKDAGPLSAMPANIRNGIQYVYQWGDFTLSQPNADGFKLTKRTKAGHGWIDVVGGERADGLGYIGGVSGGVAFAMANFWKRHPVRLDIRNAHTDAATFNVWLYSPDAPAMDLRFFHDGMGMTDHVKENVGLDITYEDYEKGWGTATGIARTNEIMLWALSETPTRERTVQMAAGVVKPPRVMTTPARIHAAGVFGDWNVVDRSTPVRKMIEDQNDYLLGYYMGQIEQRRWYGFWSHGDVMHSYDNDRHEWKYDIGGFAWDNSELSTDLWLWYSFLRSGRADVFRMAEAMTRHTGEVDMYHMGLYHGYGTRHGVQHWADSSKQLRVSTPAYRKIYYFLTADERVGDVMREVLDVQDTLSRVVVGRKTGQRSPSGAPPGGFAGTPPLPNNGLPPNTAQVGFGTDWSGIAASWLVEWERTGNPAYRTRLLNTMRGIGGMKYGFFSGGAPMDYTTGKLYPVTERFGVSHLSAVFGLVEVNSELLTLIDEPSYKKVWLDYCEFYNMSDADFKAATGFSNNGRSLRQGHSRLTAYAAVHRPKPGLAERAWDEFFGGNAGQELSMAATQRRYEGPNAIHPMDEAPRVSTNGSAQWGLAAVQNLALVPEAADAVFTRTPQVPRTGRPGAE